MLRVELECESSTQLRLCDWLLFRNRTWLAALVSVSGSGAGSGSVGGAQVGVLHWRNRGTGLEVCSVQTLCLGCGAPVQPSMLARRVQPVGAGRGLPRYNAVKEVCSPSSDDEVVFVVLKQVQGGRGVLAILS